MSVEVDNMKPCKLHSDYASCVIAIILLFLLTVPIFAQESSEPLTVIADHEGVQRVTLVLESYSFSPHDLIVETGKPVEVILKNESFLVPHSFLLDSPEGKRLVDVSVDSGETETTRFTLTQPGVYLFYCDKKLLFFPDHREEGMEGRITVR